jgi:ribonuclease III
VREQHGLPPANQVAQKLESPPLPRSLSAPAVFPSSSDNGPLSADVSVPIPPPASTSAQAAEMKGHLALFNQHLQQARRSVEWKYTEVAVGTGILADVSTASTNQAQAGTNRNLCGAGMVVPGTPMWVADVFVDGESFGRGWSSTKKSARNEAAKKGLEKMGVVSYAAWAVPRNDSLIVGCI